MGRFFYNKKATVEDTLALYIKSLNDDGLLKDKVSGTSTWKRNGEIVGSIGYHISINGDSGSIAFAYTNTSRQTGEKTDISYKVDIISTPCNYGGLRWWFVCPLIKDGKPCLKKVSVLYLYGKYFGCRSCHNLTYTSCQTSHQFDNIYATKREGKRLFERNKNISPDDEILKDELMYKVWR